MTLRQISEMVHNKRPVTMSETASVADACRCMRDRKVGAVLVTDKRHRLSGIFTGRDAVARVLAEGRDAAATRIADVMTRKPSTMSSSQNSVAALRLMND